MRKPFTANTTLVWSLTGMSPYMGLQIHFGIEWFSTMGTYEWSFARMSSVDKSKFAESELIREPMSYLVCKTNFSLLTKVLLQRVQPNGLTAKWVRLWYVKYAFCWNACENMNVKKNSEHWMNRFQSGLICRNAYIYYTHHIWTDVLQCAQFSYERWMRGNWRKLVHTRSTSVDIYPVDAFAYETFAIN